MITVSKETVETLRKAGTAVASDVFDTLGMTPLTLATDLWPTKGYGHSFAGPAYTMDGVHERTEQKGDPAKLGAIDEMTEGVVAVYAGKQMEGVCWFGDLLATAMKCRGVAGVVVDGGVRDLAFLRDLDLPMLVRYRTPAQAIGRFKLTACQKPVQVRGALTEWISINPGDIIVADDDGVISVPQEMADQAAKLAADWESKDQHAREDITNGMKLLDAVKKYGAL